MSKNLICSLFSYEPLTSSYNSSSKQVFSSDEVDTSIMSAVFESVKKVVVNEMVDTIMTALMKCDVDNLIILLDERTDLSQEEALQLLRDKLKQCVEIESVRINKDDIVSVAKETIDTINSFSEEDEITVNIPSLKSAKALGILYAAYNKSDQIKEIMYVDKKTRRVIRIPKNPIKLSKNQRKILEFFLDIKEGRKFLPSTKEYSYFRMEKSSYYDAITALKEFGLLNNEKQITEIGEIQLL